MHNVWRNKIKKVIYVGIDALKECLEMLYDQGYQIIHICTAPDDDYDRTVEIQKFAADHRIPLSLERVTVEQIRCNTAQIECTIRCRRYFITGENKNRAGRSSRYAVRKDKKVSVKLLSEYLSSPDEIWDHARVQGQGEYWEEPEI